MAGNFVIGNGKTTHGGAPRAVRTGPEVPHEENFEQPVYGGAHLLMLSGLDDAELARARAVLSSFHTVAPQQVAGRADVGS